MENERPMKLYQADLIEIDSESLTYHLEHYLFDGNEITPDIKKFFDWCKAHNKEMLHCKRGKDGKSFFERREEAKVAVREKARQFFKQI